VTSTPDRRRGWISRRVVIALAVVLLLLLAAPLAGYLLLDAETLKARAAAYVKQQTGWELAMTGPVTLSLFPWLGAEMQDVRLRPPEGGAEPLARFGELGLKVRLWPLFSRTIQVGGIVVKGGSVRVPGASGTAYELRNLALETGAFGASEPTDLSLNFEVAGAGAPLAVDLDSRLVLDLAQDLLELTDLRLTAGESSLAGRVRGTELFGATTWDAALTSDRLDLDRLLPLLGASSSSSAAKARQERSSPPPTAHATLQVKELLAYGLRFSNVEATVDSRAGLIVAKPARAGGYGGSADFAVTLDGRRAAAVPELRANGRLRSVDLQPLLRDLGQFQQFSGTGDLTLNLAARGTDVEAILRTLDGTAGVSITNGRIEGVDFVKMLQQARDLADTMRGREVEAPAAQEDATTFRRLAATSRLANGIATSEDLVLESPELGLTGRGSVDLPRETLDFTVRATSPQVKNTVVPIRISGPLASPRYRLQAGTLLKEEALEELQRQLKRRGLGGLIRKPGSN
jgi:uncharacterized protein involved in outer membrane biogenesis